MTRPYSAGGSRQGAVFTAIIALHVGVLALVASDIGLRDSGRDADREQPPIVVLPPEPEKRKPVTPDLPRPIDQDPFDVPEPELPRPDFRTPVADDAAPTAGDPVAGDGVVIVTTSSEYLAPRLLMSSRMLTALVKDCYPPASRRLAEEGRAKAWILVGSDGRILSWRLLQSTGFPRLDAAVRCIIERLAIEPGRRDGRAVEAEAILPIVFQLD